MTNFSALASTSAAAGFPYYDVQDYSFTIGGQTIAKVSGGAYHHYNQTFTLPKNRPGTALISQIMTNINMNVSTIDAVGVYRKADLGVSGGQQLGTAGGFPIAYVFEVDVWSDASNLNFIIDVSNASAVNNVTAPSITISGRVFFYLAPF